MRAGSLALSLALWAGGAAASEVTGHLAVRHASLNGVSGLEVSEDGRQVLAVSDAGWFIGGALEREGGTLSAFNVGYVEPIRDFAGFPTASRRLRELADAEGLAIGDDGRLYVAFERYMSVSPYDEIASARGFMGNLPGYLDYPDNRQVEAVAIHPDGRIFAFPERPGRWRRFTVFVHKGGRLWSEEPGPLEHRGFSIVGADFAPDGTLWLLERKYRPLLGWRNQIRRIDDVDTMEAITVWTGGWDEFYNLEGIAIFDEGRRAVLIGDNNAKGGPTDIVELRLTD